MFIDNFYQLDDNKIRITRQQASQFAKEIADDFNPLHDIDAKRFCVPGDLLFSLVLSRAGLHSNMTFDFTGMVSNDLALTFPDNLVPQAYVTDDNNKQYLSISASGDNCNNPTLISSLIKAYVEFSGHTFPHILVALMKQHQVMINPQRPMIMYESMSISLDRFDVEQVSLALAETSLEIDGKRGNACLQFNLVADGEIIGHGKKHMLLSALRPYCQDTIDHIVTSYNQSKLDYIRCHR
jgi:hypothetical protein